MSIPRNIIDGFLTALKPFVELGGDNDLPAFHDLPGDTVLYKNSGRAITAGDVRFAKSIYRRYGP